MGYERLTNWALRVSSERNFVREVLAGQPDPPRYFARMKKLNRQGPPLLDSRLMPPKRSDIVPFSNAVRDSQVVDVRSAESYAAAHVPGTITIPLEKSFALYAGNVLSYDKDIVLIADSEEQAFNATRVLRLIGLDNVSAWFSAEILREFRRAGGELRSTKGVLINDAVKLSNTTILDVRNESEWNEGHVLGAKLIPLGQLESRINEVPKSAHIAVHCRTGGRSPVAVSLLERAGFKNVLDITDGFEAYKPEAKRAEKKTPLRQSRA